MIITIGGNVGAGKTTLAMALGKNLNYEEFSMGGLMRATAAERGMTIEEFYTKLEKEPDLEKSIDDAQVRLMHEKDNLVIQGRIAWFFARSSPFKIFNIFLKVNPEVGAKRSAQREENLGRPIDEVLAANIAREETERQRYASLYDITDFTNPNHYHLVLDTTNLTEKEVLEKILAEVKKVSA